jgi:membrane protein
MRRKLSVFFGFFAYVVRRFVEENCPLWAGMLTYASLLALVPLLVVVLAVVAAFPVFEQWAGQVESFILQNFVPAAGSVAREYLVEFVGRARELSLIGVVFLVLSALLLMFSIDTVVNHIWRVHRRRTLSAKFLVYWAVLTVGPILIGASIVVSTNIIPTLRDAVFDPGLRLLALRAVPVGISILTFALIYYFVPNVRVRILHAFVGGVVAALMFEVSKAGFATYLRQFPTYEAIYGAFAVVPIFLAWTYLSWIVLLFGASFAAAFASYGRDRATGAWPEDQELLLVYRVLQHLWDAQQRGGALTPDQLLELELELDDDQLMRVLHKLDRARVVQHEESGAFRLVRDLRELTLIDLCRTVPIGLPVLPSEDAGDRRWLRPVYRAFAELDDPLKKTLAQPLAQFFEASSAAEHPEPEPTNEA